MQMKSLGYELTETLTQSAQTSKCITKTTAAAFSMQALGITRATMSPMLKVHLYKVYCRPLLTSGLEAGDLSTTDIRKLQTIEGKLIKWLFGLDKTARTTKLLYAIGLEPVADLLDQLRAGSYRRILSNPTTKKAASEFLKEENNRKNKSKTLSTEFDLFVHKYATPNLKFDSVDTQNKLNQIEQQIKQQTIHEITNSDREIAALIGNGEWRERLEVIEANEKLRQILASHEHKSKQADTAFISLEDTFLNDSETD